MSSLHLSSSMPWFLLCQMRWVPAPLHCLIEGWVRAEGCSVVLPYVLEPCCHMATRAAGRIKPLNSPFDSCQSRGIVTCYSYASEITNHCHISMYKRDPSNSLAPVLSLKNLETNICPCTYLSRHLNIFVSSLIAAEDIISGIVYICFKCFLSVWVLGLVLVKTLWVLQIWLIQCMGNPSM